MGFPRSRPTENIAHRAAILQNVRAMRMTRPRHRLPFLCLALALALILPAAAGAQGGAASLPFAGRTVDRIVAWIDDEPVALSEVEKAITEYQARGDVPIGPPDLGRMRRALQFWIDEELLLREAQRLGVEAPGEVIDNEVDPMIERIESREGGPAEFDRLLERTGETRASLRDRLRRQLRREWTIARFVQSRVNISDADVQAFEKERQAQGQATVRYHVSHFFLPMPPTASESDWKEAEEAGYQLRMAAARGGDFLAAAQELAQRRTAQGAQAGRLGALEPSELDPALLAALKNTDVNRTTDPIRTDRGVHVLFLERTTTARQILSALRFDEEKAKMVAELRNRSTIRVIDPALKP